MIKEGGKMVKKGGERMMGTFRFLGVGAILALDKIVHPSRPAGADGTHESTKMLPAPNVVRTNSPLDNVGPIPAELRMDPFPGGSVPWSILEAEKEQNQARKVLVWKIAITVSWSVTFVAVLRAIGVL
jgi:hypothetical protein